MTYYEIRPVGAQQVISGPLPMVSQSTMGEGRECGLQIECPLCTPENRRGECTWVHPIDSRSEQREAIYGSDRRFVANVLLGCEAGGHYFVLEITNRKGAFNMGLRTPYDGELVAEWCHGTFDNWVHSDTVHFAPNFEVPA